jgi:hypothetical protein
MTRTALPAFSDHQIQTVWPQTVASGAFSPLGLRSTHRSASETEADTNIATLAAFAEGVAVGRSEAGREAAAALAVLQSQQQNNIVAARQAWVTEESERMGCLIAEGVAAIDTRVRVDVARILELCVSRAVDLTLVAAFSEQVARAVGRISRTQVTISGRADLCEAIVTRLTLRGITAVANPTKAAGVMFELGETTITAVPPPIIAGEEEAIGS